MYTLNINNRYNHHTIAVVFTFGLTFSRFAVMFFFSSLNLISFYLYGAKSQQLLPESTLYCKVDPPITIWTSQQCLDLTANTSTA